MSNPLNQFLDLTRRKSLLQWENYAEVAAHSLNELDKELFDLFKGNAEIHASSVREQQLWNKVRIATLIASEKSIAALRNKLDDWDNYPLSNKGVLARSMRPDVERLFHLRQERAQQLGYSSYPDLVYECEELSSQFVHQLIGDFYERNLLRAQSIVKTHGLTHTSWFEQLRKLTQSRREIVVENEISRVAETFGCDRELAPISVMVKVQSIAGVVIAINPPTDVRMLLSPITSLNQLRTLYHELGHGLAATCNREPGLSRHFSAVYDEVMAVIFEKMAVRALVDEDSRQKLADVGTVEIARLAISHQFEKQLWDSLDFAKAEEWFEKGWAELGVQIEDAALWALDSFRSIDPVYVHNYVLGDLYGRLFVEHCEREFGSDHKAWFHFLKSQFLCDGMARSFASKTAFLI